MINLSVDAADDLEGRTFDPTVNEIESVVELFLEVIMGQSDALPEHDEPDPEAQTCQIGIDHIMQASCLIDMAIEPYSTLSNPPILTFLNYKNPILSYHLPPPRKIS